MSYLTARTPSDSPIQELKVEDCSDVSGTPQNGQFLKYDGSAFAMSEIVLEEKGLNFNSNDGAVRPGVGSTNYYGPSQSYRWRLLYYYDVNVLINTDFNLSSGGFWLTLNTTPNGYGELAGAYLPAGTYAISFNLVMFSNQSTSESVWRFATGPATGTAPTTSNTTLVGPYWYHAPRVGRFVTTPKIVMTLTDSTTLICLRCVSSSYSSLSRPTTQSHWYQFHAEKIG